MKISFAVIVFTIVLMLIGNTAIAHCDTMDGPVVLDAKAAVEKADVTPVLKWVHEEQEQEIREAFKKTLAVRKQGAEARELADLYFFETVVRLHRASEGAPYTGLKPAGTSVDPSVKLADESLESGSADKLVNALTGAVSSGIRERFADAREKRLHSDESVEAGREYVDSYVEFVHYVERLHQDATRQGHGDGSSPPHDTHD